MGSWSVVLPVVVPLFAAVLLAALRPLLRSRAADVIAIAAAAAGTGFSAWLWSASRNGTIVYWLGNWKPRQGIALGICFTVDPVGAGLATLCGILAVAALIFSSKYFDPAGTLYHVLMLTFLAAMSGFSLSGDAFNMFVFFELMTASAFALCGYKTEERESLQGACNFAVTNTVGAFLILDGIALIYARTGALNLAQIGRALASRPDALVLAGFVFIVAGFLIKAALVPFHLWLADAHAVAPTPVCVLFSGVMVELGIYGVARFYWTVFAGPLPPSTAALKTTFIVLGALTAVVGGVMCVVQFHLKRLLAFSTISHMGVLLIGIGLMRPDAMSGVWVYLAGHSLAKAALFIGSGILLHAFKTVQELEVKGRGRVSPLTGVIFVGGGLALAGLPPFSTFFGAELLEDAAKKAGYSGIPVVIAIAGILTGGAVLRASGRIFLGMGRGQAPAAGQHSSDDAEKESPISRLMTIPAAVLLALAVFVGIPQKARDGALQYSARMQNSEAYAGRVLDGTVMPETTAKSPNILASRFVRGSVPALLALALAWFMLTDRSRALRAAPALRPARSLMTGLRALHSGVIGDYVVWIVAGVVALGVALMAGV